MSNFFDTLIFLLFSWLYGSRAFVEPTLMDLTFAQPEMAQDIAVGPVSLVSDGRWHSFAFRITNLRPTTRCFMKLTLQPVGPSGTIRPIETYVDGQVQRIDDEATGTTTCLRPGETGFVLESMMGGKPPRGFVLQAIKDHKRRDWTVSPSRSVSIIRQSLEGPTMKVVLRNEAVAKGFQSIGHARWVITQGEKILGWGYLELGSRWSRKPVKLHETVEISTDHVLGKPLPAGADLQILLDDVE